MALLALLALPSSAGAADLGRLLRQANFQEKAGCLHEHESDVRHHAPVESISLPHSERELPQWLAFRPARSVYMILMYRCHASPSLVIPP